LEIINETTSKGDAGFTNTPTPVDSEIVNENWVIADSEIINETASTGDPWIHQRPQPLLTQN
jgi:hypothetical protein